MKYFTTLLFATLLTGLAGCTNDSSVTSYLKPFDLSTKDRLSIKKIHIEVFEPADPPFIYLSGLSGNTDAGSIVGGVDNGFAGHHSAIRQARKNIGKKYALHWKKNNISINSIVASETTSQIKSDTQVQITDFKSADTILNIYIIIYGFTSIDREDNKHQEPYVRLEAHLKRKNNEMIAVLNANSEMYSQPKYATMYLPILSRTDINDNLKKVKDALEVSSRIAVSNITGQLIQY
jgi:hypothetical protein